MGLHKARPRSCLVLAAVEALQTFDMSIRDLSLSHLMVLESN